MAEVQKPRLEVSRRTVLLATLSAGLAGILPEAQAQEALGDPDLASLGAVLDTLLPADEHSPAASALGIEQEMRAILTANPLLLRLAQAALGWMDSLAPVPFRDLEERQRTAIIANMARSDFNQVPGRFYHVIRALAVEFYFARPGAFAEYPLNPAPQPIGYPPPWT